MRESVARGGTREDAIDLTVDDDDARDDDAREANDARDGDVIFTRASGARDEDEDDVARARGTTRMRTATDRGDGRDEAADETRTGRTGRTIGRCVARRARGVARRAR